MTSQRKNLVPQTGLSSKQKGCKRARQGRHLDYFSTREPVLMLSGGLLCRGPAQQFMKHLQMLHRAKEAAEILQSLRLSVTTPLFATWTGRDRISVPALRLVPHRMWTLAQATQVELRGQCPKPSHSA